MAPDQGDVRSLLGLILLRAQEVTEREASGWLVVVTDLESNTITGAYGPKETPEAALILAGEMDACPHTGTHPADGEPGWRHDVVPLYAV